MIKINKKDEPPILLKNSEEWTNNLLDSVSTYGGYDKIPKSIKENLLSHYRHKDIQKALAESSYYKCAFCECKPGESGNIEVEHFEPKSLYYEKTFNWDNLLPSCRKCNDAKLMHDTRTTPIINPTKEDPEELLTYEQLWMCPAAGSEDEAKAKKTIEVCNLNSSRLYQVRANLMTAITEYVDELEEKLQYIYEADTPQKKTNRITKLSNSLDKIDALFEPSAAFSGYCKWLITRCEAYQEAKKIVSNR